MKDIKLTINEIEKYFERLNKTRNKILTFELTPELLEIQDKIEIIDSFIFRFTKIQDTIGNKLFPAILMILEEEYKNKSFIDILNRLEQLEYLPSVNSWKKIRELRNSITHTYPWEKEILINEIKLALKYSDELNNIFNNIKNKLIGKI